MQGKIGVFDSGFGGLDVLRGIVAQLPQYDYVYFGDTARTPYGSRSGEIIYEFTRQAVDFLFAQGCELIIVACNTASAQALRRIQQEYLPTKYPDKRVLGVLIPFAEAATSSTRSKQIGVIGTSSTISSRRFVEELEKIDPAVQVFQQACPLLVPIVEAGEHASPVARLVLCQYLDTLLEKNIDTLILGCTHYGVLKDSIQHIVGNEVSLIVGSEVVGVKLADYLARHPEIETKLSTNGERTFYSTDLTDGFAQLGMQFFGQPIEVEKITLI